MSSYNVVMRQLTRLILILMLGLLSACGGGQIEPEAPPEPSAPPIGNTRPAPEVSTSVPTLATTAPATVEATNTFAPDVAGDDEATPTPEPTAVPTTPPQTPIQAIDLWQLPVSGLELVTDLTHAFDERLFVLEQPGRIRIIENDELLEQPFLDIQDRVGSASSEQGLLGLAFHPDYATPGAEHEGDFFVNYTDYSGNTHISRFSVFEDDPYRADPGSEVQYLYLKQPYENHNGGSLAFGPDGYLYAGLGDGGSGGDPLRAGQDLTTWLGKVLRLDVDSAADSYTIPPDNPFVDVDGARPEIWAYGLRNPWRFSFDRVTGDFFIADVGQNTFEEVNFQPAGSPGGENYGWSIMEASHCFEADSCDRSGLVLPIFEYGHSQGCSITGGYVYRGREYPEMTGNYFVADYCSGIIWRLFHDGAGWLSDPLLDSDLIISSFGEDVHGELYALNYGTGGIYRVLPGGHD